MYKVCTTEAAAARQRWLEERLRLLLNEREYRRINVSDFCRFVNVPRKTFYRYFSGMDGALYALLDHTMIQLNWNPRQWIREKPEKLCRELENLFAQCLKYRDFLDALVRSHLETVILERALICAFRGPQPEPFQYRPNPASPEEMAVCCIIYTLLIWQRADYEKSAGEIAGGLTGLLENPLARRE